MCRHTPTLWSCGHTTYAIVSCGNDTLYKLSNVACPFDTTLGVRYRNGSCGKKECDDNHKQAQAQAQAVAEETDNSDDQKKKKWTCVIS